MPRYNHAFDFAAEVVSDDPAAEDVTPEMLKQSLLDRIASMSINEFIDACGIFDTHEVEDPLDHLFYQVRDPKHQMLGFDVPASTTLLMKVCANDGTRFEEACRVVSLFMQAAYQKGKNDQ